MAKKVQRWMPRNTRNGWKSWKKIALNIFQKEGKKCIGFEIDNESIALIDGCIAVIFLFYPQPNLIFFAIINREKREKR